MKLLIEVIIINHFLPLYVAFTWWPPTHHCSGAVLCLLLPTVISLFWAFSNNFRSWVASLNSVRLSSSCWHASCLCSASAALSPRAIANSPPSKLITSWRLSSENEIKNAGSFLILSNKSGEMLSTVFPASVPSISTLSFLSKLALKIP